MKALNKLAAPGLFTPAGSSRPETRRCAGAASATPRRSRATLDKGMKELTGATDAVEAWKHFFEPGDVVGIKVVPNGQPDAHSSFEIVLEVIEKLRAAGVKTRDIFVYDRYRASSWRPATTRSSPTASAGAAWTRTRTSSSWTSPLSATIPIAGFDHDAFVWMDLVPYGDDPKDDRKYRSHLGKLVTKTLNKIVAIPVLKDHGSAGVTGALKNMSHGSVNNVARSHSNTFTNVCNQFIPQVVTHPIIREKFVLQIMDGIRGVFQGGPFRARTASGPGKTTRSSSRPTRWRWTTSSGTIIDAQRAKMNLPPVAASRQAALDPLKTEGFDVRQPQHIALAGALGLGYFDYKSHQGPAAFDRSPGRERLKDDCGEACNRIDDTSFRAGSAVLNPRSTEHKPASGLCMSLSRKRVLSSANSLPRICRARDLIRDFYTAEVTLGDLRTKSGLSPWHLLRSFRDVFGETPKEFHTRLRLEQAKHLLTVTDRSVTEICFDVGFSSLGTFSASVQSPCWLLSQGGDAPFCAMYIAQFDVIAALEEKPTWRLNRGAEGAEEENPTSKQISVTERSVTVSKCLACSSRSRV